MKKYFNFAVLGATTTLLASQLAEARRHREPAPVREPEPVPQP